MRHRQVTLVIAGLAASLGAATFPAAASGDTPSSSAVVTVVAEPAPFVFTEVEPTETAAQAAAQPEAAKPLLNLDGAADAARAAVDALSSGVARVGAALSEFHSDLQRQADERAAAEAAKEKAKEEERARLAEQLRAAERAAEEHALKNPAPVAEHQLRYAAFDAVGYTVVDIVELRERAKKLTEYAIPAGASVRDAVSVWAYANGWKKVVWDIGARRDFSATVDVAYGKVGSVQLTEVLSEFVRDLKEIAPLHVRLYDKERVIVVKLAK